MDTPRTRFALDGAWSLVLDPQDQGVREQWYKSARREEALDVTVPGVWDQWAPDYDGVGWYYRSFEAPTGFAGRHVEICFEAADYFAEVWLNGVRLGAHEGGYTPFSFPVSAHLKEGENLVAVRIVDPHGAAGVGEFLPGEIPCAKERGYWSFAGIWGSVFLECRPKRHIEDVFIQPDIRRKRITVTVEAPGDSALRLRIEGTAHVAEGKPGAFTMDFPDFETWSPDEPHLYSLRVDLVEGENIVDSVAVRFGMREFTTKDNRFYLNGRPCHVKAVLLQPDYPGSLAAPVDEAMARREIELAKAAGFNMIRVHLRPAPAVTLDLADELGMMIYEEPPIGWIETSRYVRERCEREVREMILRDRNHPSVVVWGMLNESGSAACDPEGGAQPMKDALCYLARDLDPSRLVIDDSGGANITRVPSRMMRPYREAFDAYDDLHIYQRAPVDYDIESYFRHNGDPEALVFLSEFGFGGPEALGDVIGQYGGDAGKRKDARFLQQMRETAEAGFAERELDRVFGDFEGFLAAGRALQGDAARHQLDAIRSNPKYAGYCYTQLADAGHEFCAGMLDRWRRKKPVFDAITEAQQPVRPIIQFASPNLTPRAESQVTILLANESRIEGRADLSLQVVGPTNQVLWKKKRGVKIPRHGKELWNGTVAASGSPGKHRFIVRVMQGMKRIAESAIDFHVHKDVEPAPVGVHVLDPRNEWQKRIAPLATPRNLLAPVHVIPPLGNTIRAYPDNDLMQVLAQVKGGAVALFFGPPEDWNDLARQLDEPLEATQKDAVGAFLPVLHYVKMHPVFNGLPSRCLMRQPYRNVVPARTFIEKSDEDICGAFDTAPAAAGDFGIEDTPWWGSDILVRRYGSGRVVFTHLRILEHLGEDPVADQIFVNLLNHFARRSVPSDSPLPVHKKAVEWLRRESADHARRWMVMGEFPNWGGSGHQKAYPPEAEVNLSATYPGWYKAISWEPWYTRSRDGHLLDLQQAFSPVYEYYPRFDHGTGYAYAEFACEKRSMATLRLGVQGPMKVWLNGKLVFETNAPPRPGKLCEEEADCLVKQGRNALLVKCSKNPGPFRFSLDLETHEGEPLNPNWWK